MGVGMNRLMYESIEEFEAIVGYRVNKVFKDGWRHARMELPPAVIDIPPISEARVLDKNKVRERRLLHKIEEKNRKIKGLVSRMQRLENALATRTMDLESLSRNIGREVQDALCNVRMIPVRGIPKMDRIMDIRLFSPETQLKEKEVDDNG